jgi:cysteine desulfurase
MAEVMASPGNPSSVHAAGRAARARLERAREDVAALIGAPASTVVFLSGGTEADALAVRSAVAAGARRLIVSAQEHDAVRDGAAMTGAEVEIWPVRADGTADLDWLSERLGRWDSADGRPFVALMLANNETGVIQPVAAAAEIVRAHDGWLHVDAVQAAGKIPVDSRALGADTLAVSAHKLGGPQCVCSMAADRSAGGAAEPRTCPASPASARRRGSPWRNPRPWRAMRRGAMRRRRGSRPWARW